MTAEMEEQIKKKLAEEEKMLKKKMENFKMSASDSSSEKAEEQ